MCPINFDDPRGPRYFNGEDDALAFFTEQRVNGKAPEWLLPIPVVSRVKSHKGTPVSARLNETSLPVSLGAAPLFTLAERPPERSDDGSRGEPSLIHRSVTLEEILRSPAEQIPGIFETVSIERAGRELSGTLEDELALAQGCATCCLNEDWRHSEIETSARQLPGNDLRRQRGSIREYIVIAMRDYDTARAKIWPHSSNSEMADFWRSWQAHRHLICFGARLAKCDVATALAGSAEAARDAVNEAVNCVSLELARYANGLEAEALATVAVR